MTRPGGAFPRSYGGGPSGGRESANLADILERVLDRGVVIVGDIRVNLLDIELLTIKLRLLIASVDTARELGIDWWEHDPWLTSQDRDLVEENRVLRDRLAGLEGVEGIEGADSTAGTRRRSLGRGEGTRSPDDAREPRRAGRFREERDG
ncbi:gas vesicle protein [Streptosporangium sp. NBC_01495]|nr:MULTISPECIES: gas vesicle protein [unclassified Streptosporangium]